jgi:biopolymer transport protein ExbD
MGYGPSALVSKAEPNLTSLLDVVLQLLLFFILCVNFVVEQVSESVHLPVAQSARPMDKSADDVLFLNLEPNGHLRIFGRPEPLRTLGEMNYYLKTAYDDTRRHSRDPAKTLVVLRADRDVPFARVFLLLRMCKDVGYRKLQLRALTEG